MSPVPGRDQLLSSALFGHYPHSLRGFARGEAWILEVHYQRQRYRCRYKYLLQIWVFPFATLAAGVGLGDVSVQGRGRGRGRGRAMGTSPGSLTICMTDSRKSMCGPSIKRPINSCACHTSIKAQQQNEWVTDTDTNRATDTVSRGCNNSLKVLPLHVAARLIGFFPCFFNSLPRP